MACYYLYVKTHIDTGLKYLGYTVKKNPYKYLGSGTRWRNHIKVHGNNINTEILLNTEHLDEIRIWGLYYSELWNVVKSNEWANLIPEDGSNGGGIGRIGKTHTPETKKMISEKHKGKLGLKGSDNGMYGKKHSNEWKDIVSKKNKGKTTWNKGVPCTESVKQIVSIKNTGRVQSEETKNKRSKTMTGKSKSIQHKLNLTGPKAKFTCPHCSSTVGGKSNFNRWHNDNCYLSPAKNTRVL